MIWRLMWLRWLGFTGCLWFTDLSGRATVLTSLEGDPAMAARLAAVLNATLWEQQAFFVWFKSLRLEYSFVIEVVVMMTMHHMSRLLRSFSSGRGHGLRELMDNLEHRIAARGRGDRRVWRVCICVALVLVEDLLTYFEVEVLGEREREDASSGSAFQVDNLTAMSIWVRLLWSPDINLMLILTMGELGKLGDAFGQFLSCTSECRISPQARAYSRSSHVDCGRSSSLH